MRDLKVQARLDREQASYLASCLDAIFAPRPPAQPDDAPAQPADEVWIDELMVEIDEAEAQRFDAECARDAALGDDYW